MLRLLSSFFSGRASDSSNDRLTRVIAEIPSHIAAAIVVRSMTGELEYLSSYIEVLTGHAKDEFQSSSTDLLRQLIHEKDRGMYDRCIAVAASGEQFEQTVRLRHQTGIELFAEIRAVPILGETGEVTSVMLVLLNVTGSIRYQQTIEEKNKDLADFTLMLSHDLKAPIHSIKGLIPIVSAAIPGEEADAVEALRLISSATGGLDRLINGVLEYARISDTEVEMLPVDIGGVVKDCLESFKVQLNAANCRLEVSDKFPMVRGDRLRLTQIVANLLSNSLKYRAQNRVMEMQITTREVGAMIQLEITDNGTGIPAAKLSQVFRPFQRAHGAHIEGAGIGLALVKRLVNRLGGEVSIASVEGQGTTVTILLQSVA